MTLTYALIADGGIILAADSQGTDSHQIAEGHESRLIAAYQGTVSKIRSLPNGSAFSIAGNSALVEHLLLEAEHKKLQEITDFIESTLAYSRLFREEFIKLYDEDENPPHCDFLFCGYAGKNGDKDPYIVKLSSRCRFGWNVVAPGKGYGFSGREQHGAVLYLHHRLYSPGMPMESAKCMAYCILAEVADSDNIVGFPIEMAIITKDGVGPFSGFDQYEQKRQSIISAVRAVLKS